MGQVAYFMDHPFAKGWMDTWNELYEEDWKSF